MTSRIPSNVETAEEILDELLNRYPDHDMFRFNSALSKSLLKKYDEALLQTKKLAK